MVNDGNYSSGQPVLTFEKESSMSASPAAQPAAPAESALATRTPTVILTPDDYRAGLLRWQRANYNVLTPFTHISGLAAQHGIFTSMVQIDLNPAAAMCYGGLPFLKRGKDGDDEVALAKNGLRMIAEGLGISTRLEYICVGPIRHYWHVKAIASYTGLDGRTIHREGSEEWDLRDGSERLTGWTANQISEGRKHGLRNCETRAINAAIRECGCGVKQAYRKSELQRPFLTIRVAFQPDMSDPEQKRMVLEHSLGSTNALYGPTLPAALSLDEEPAAVEPRRIGASTTTPTPAATAAPPVPDPHQPPTPGAVRFVDSKSASGKDPKGRAWTCWTFIDSNGVEVSTFKKDLADAAQRALEAETWLDVTTEQNGPYTNIVEIMPAGQQPALPDLGAL
jgi:hypothetical protein